jgi:hypothetical protein
MNQRSHVTAINFPVRLKVIPRIATFSPCTATHRIGDTVGQVDGDGRFGRISSGAAGSIRGGDALRFVPAAMGVLCPRPSAIARGA